MSDAGELLREIGARLGLVRPLCVLDLETTGVDVNRDRIVEVAALIVRPTGEVNRVRTLVRPEVSVPSRATRVHGLGEGELLGAPTFREIAPALARHLAPCDFAGYNVGRFDLRLLAREFERAGVAYDPTAARVVDAMTIFKRMERRDLASAVRHYTGRTHRGHRAMEDVDAVVSVLHAQLARYPELPRGVAALDVWCRGDERRQAS